ncbi:MAG: PKD domain-containing protein [Flavobacteriaceae bacterium]|nr:PKD domain-containing protein [Flavobacteriaceae bacterium]
MSTKLDHITTQYKRFTKNQVLTESHLNEVLDYFDDQDRLSRICLSGTGIVCGFNVKCTLEGTVEITQGSGVTTDGDLFHLYEIDEETSEKIIDIDKKVYTHYRVYDNEKSPYNPFFYQGNNQIDLFELLTEEGDEETFPISQLGTNHQLAIKDAVVLLYLETYEKDQDLCVSLSCDNQGAEIIGNYKVLVTSKANAAHIKSFDTTLSKTNFEHLFYQLPDILANRAIVLKEDFDNVIKLRNKFAAETLKNNIINRVKQGFSILLNGLSFYDARNLINQRIDSLFSYTENNVPYDFQYRYDLLKDIIDTYNEIKNLLAIAEASNCCADIKAFPKHLMLGEVEKENNCYEYRHGFYKSPILNSNSSNCGSCDPKEGNQSNENTLPEDVINFEFFNLDICYDAATHEKHLKHLIKRVVLMVTNYNSYYNYIKTTPSFLLGEVNLKAIPFYFNVGNHLISSWNFDKTIKGKHLKNISYHNSLLDIKRPLKFSIDHDFYRIEGHQGVNYKQVLSVLKETKRTNALSFNVVALSINSSEATELLENYTSYYLEKNIGLEHKAGVTPGGTFVIIYQEGEHETYPYYGYYGYEYYGYEYGNNRIPFGNDFVEEDTDNTRNSRESVLNPVIADFMLPYLCCDDNIVELRLPVDHLCFTNETEPLAFEVSPKGGFVEAIVEEGLNGGVIRNDAGSFLFDPNEVSEELHGVEIIFRVNNLDTECKITIQPEVIFNVILGAIIYDYNANTANVTFNINGNSIPNGQEFSWNFGDGSNVLISSNQTITHTYNLDDIDGTNVIVTTNATNGECSTEVETQVEFVIIPDISLDETEFCRNDQSLYQFNVIPPTSELTIEGEGVGQNASGFFFIPANVPDSVTTVTFTVNGVISSFIVTMNEAPTANFTHQIVNEQLILDNNSSLTLNYQWNVDGEIINRTTRNRVVRNLSIFNTDIITISLRANSEDCGFAMDGPREVVIRETQELTCEERAELFMNNTLAELNEIKNNPLFNELPDQTIILFNDLAGKYTQVESRLSEFLRGDHNNNLPQLFNQPFYIDLLESIRLSETDFDQRVLEKLSELIIKLAYTILRCQDSDMIVEFETSITRILKDITNFLEQLKNNGIQIDSEGLILEYLESIKETFADFNFISSEIDSQIAALQ